jgi:hypothetical protein
MEVRIVCPLPSSNCPEGDYVRVQTCAAPDDDTMTIATIERIVAKTREPADGGSWAKRVKTLVLRARMSADQALGLATRYAERKQIPVVYAERSLEAR